MLVASRRKAHRGFSRTIVRGGILKWTRGHKAPWSGRPVQLSAGPDHSPSPIAARFLGGQPRHRV